MRLAAGPGPTAQNKKEGGTQGSSQDDRAGLADPAPRWACWRSEEGGGGEGGTRARARREEGGGATRGGPP